MADTDALKPGWRFMGSVWHYFDQGRSACGKFAMSTADGTRRTAPKKATLTAEERRRWVVCRGCGKQVQPNDLVTELRAGDIVTLTGATVPPGWERYFFRVETIGGDGSLALSAAYLDEACLRPVRHEAAVTAASVKGADGALD